MEQQRNTLELEHQRRMMALELREQEVQVGGAAAGASGRVGGRLVGTNPKQPGGAVRSLHAHQYVPYTKCIRDCECPCCASCRVPCRTPPAPWRGALRRWHSSRPVLLE